MNLTKILTDGVMLTLFESLWLILTFIIIIPGSEGMAEYMEGLLVPFSRFFYTEQLIRSLED